MINVVDTVDLLDDIHQRHGLYYVVAFLHDCHFSRDDVARILEEMRRRGFDHQTVFK